MSRHVINFSLLIVLAIAQSGCGGPMSAGSNEISTDNLNAAVFTDDNDQEGKKMETATLGAGCFWCVEAVFQQLEGVASVKSGYMGGEVENPTYRQICTGLTGHAEVCQIKYDPEVISLMNCWKFSGKRTTRPRSTDRAPTPGRSIARRFSFTMRNRKK